MIAYLILFSFLQCCNWQTVQPNAQVKTYFPNKTGSSWQYEVYDSSRIRDHAGFPRSYNVTVTIAGTKIMADGRPASIWLYQYPWGEDTGYLRIDGDTVKVYDQVYSATARGLLFPRQVWLPPFKLNDRWAGKLLYTDSFHIVDQSAVMTPAQTFTGCFTIYHYYRGPNIEYKDRYWFKPYTGMVKIYYHQYSLGILSVQLWQLKKYSFH